MATMLGAGVPLLKALDNIASNARSGGLRSFAVNLSKFIVGGGRLSDGIEKLPGIHDEYIINMVRVGEQGGFLDAKFREIAEFLEKVQRFRMTFISGLIYPLILFHGSVLFPPLFYFFIGQPVTYFRVTLSVLIPFYLIVLFTWALYATLGEIREIRTIFDFFLAYFPLIGGVMRKLAVSRFTRALSNLFEAGVGVTPSIRIASQACGNVVLAERLERMGDMVDKGVSLSKSLQSSGLFSSTALQLIATGEESGDVVKLLKKTSDFIDEQLEESMARFFVVLPVIFYIILGVYIGYVFITGMLKLYQGILI